MLTKIIHILSSAKLPLTNEKELQNAINELLTVNNIPFVKEAILNDNNIVDFLADDNIAIETKINHGFPFTGQLIKW